MGLYDGLPLSPNKEFLRKEISRIDESWAVARFDSLPHVVHILTSKDRDGDVEILKQQSDVVENVVDEVVHHYHTGFNKAIQNYSQDAKQMQSIKGRFYSNLGIDKVYKGGEVLYLDGVDVDKMTLTELNTWAYNIWYCEGPITFQYKISGSDPGSEYLPIYKDHHVVDMFALTPKSNPFIDIYICCLAARKSLDELEAETNHVVYHSSGHIIFDLPLEEERVVVEQERVVVEEERVVVEDVFNDEELMHQTFGNRWENAESREKV